MTLLQPPCAALSSILQAKSPQLRTLCQLPILQTLRTLLAARHPASAILIVLVAPAVVLGLVELGSIKQNSTEVLSLISEALSVLLVVQSHAPFPASMVSLLLPILISIFNMEDPSQPQHNLAVQVALQLIQQYPHEAQKAIDLFSPHVKQAF